MRAVGAGTGGCDVDIVHVSYEGRWYAVSVERHAGPQVYRKGLVGEETVPITDLADPVLAKALKEGLDS